MIFFSLFLTFLFKYLPFCQLFFFALIFLKFYSVNIFNSVLIGKKRNEKEGKFRCNRVVFSLFPLVKPKRCWTTFLMNCTILFDIMFSFCCFFFCFSFLFVLNNFIHFGMCRKRKPGRDWNRTRLLTIYPAKKFGVRIKINGLLFLGANFQIQCDRFSFVRFIFFLLLL